MEIRKRGTVGLAVAPSKAHEVFVEEASKGPWRRFSKLNEILLGGKVKIR